MADRKTIVLLSLSRWENPKKLGTGYELRVVQEVLDGRSLGVGVEKVYFYQEGTKAIGKPLNGKDLNVVWENRARIKDLMDHPPALPEIQPAGGDIAEVPF